MIVNVSFIPGHAQFCDRTREKKAELAPNRILVGKAAVTRMSHHFLSEVK